MSVPAKVQLPQHGPPQVDVEEATNWKAAPSAPAESLQPGGVAPPGVAFAAPVDLEAGAGGGGGVVGGDGPIGEARTVTTDKSPGVISNACPAIGLLLLQGFITAMLSVAVAVIQSPVAVPLVLIPTVIYIVVVCMCRPTICKRNRAMTPAEAEELLSVLRATDSTRTLRAECFHYETRTRTVSDGNGGTKTETTREKVVTHRATETVTWTTCVDHTSLAGLARLVDFDFTIMKIGVDVRIAPSSRPAYTAVWEGFKARNRFDSHQRYTETDAIEGHVPEIAVYTTADMPWWSSSWMYFALAFLPVALPLYLILLDAGTAKQTETVVKEVTLGF
mmetsp:Transcript_15756/g.53471  ORF Transcript_15756/g.53471 Transcript_15756/m.53471 type:complete len:334 (+) Transcript_15756:99-1100(+)